MKEEAEELRKRFIGVNRAEFARTYGIKGGQQSIYNHIKALRPISLDAARRYAKGFGCTLGEISPRLAVEVEAAKKYTPGPDGNIQAPANEDQLSDPWPFSGVEQAKVRALSERERTQLETALLLAAAQLGLDIKKI